MKRISKTAILAVICLLLPLNARAAEGDKTVKLTAHTISYEKIFTKAELEAFSSPDNKELSKWITEIEREWIQNYALCLSNEDVLIDNIKIAIANQAEGYVEYSLNHYITPIKAAAAQPQPESIIASYATPYEETEDRAVNIHLAGTFLNGIRLLPQQSISFSEAVKSRTFENGYVVAPSLAGGRVVTSVGGGICQVSSTLYNAILQCGIIPDERHNHSGSVYYSQLGLDAAIASGAKDLRFTNTLEYPITLQVIAENGLLTIEILSSQDALKGYQYLPISKMVGPKAAEAYLSVYKGEALLGNKFLGTSRYITVF